MLNTDKILEKEINAVGRDNRYQLVYGHPEYDLNARRPCVDRLQDIKKIYDALSNELKRPLRVLDLGCNFGFFSFHIAEWGGW